MGKDKGMEEERRLFNILETYKNALRALLTSGIVTETLLWENEDVTSAFTPKTISLNLSGFDSVKVMMCSSKVYTSELHIHETPIMKSHRMTYINTPTGSTSAFRERLYEVSDTGVTFRVARMKNVNTTTGSDNNELLIPYRIYGIKHIGGGVG